MTSSANNTGYGSSEDENASHQLLRAGTSHYEMWDNEDSSVDHDLSEYEQYGTTPPRTRILRRNRERKQRDLKDYPWSAGKSKMLSNKRLLNRRNTISNTFDELIARADNPDSEGGGKRVNKRSMKLLRGSERDLKLDIASAQLNAANTIEHKYESITPLPFIQVEGCRRFMSLCSRRVAHSNKSVATKVAENNANLDHQIECSQSRIDFHKTLSILIRMGCGEKPAPDRGTRRHISREEYLWQNELKDLIWLELQAWHADRSPGEQDSYLCNSRELAVGLIDDIMTYRFSRHKHHSSTHSSDSGVEDDCLGCLSMTCQSCMEAQYEALKDIEKLMNRLEAAESLFPSSKSFAELYPTYNSPEFVGRVKAMCLWYNMTRHQLLKIIILGRLLTLEDKLWLWPFDLCSDTNSIDSSSPSDSNSSTSSVNDFLSINAPVVLTSISALINNDSKKQPSPYRKYIENMLKTKGLTKSLNFLEKLHQHLLWKTEITLCKPTDDTIFTKVNS